VSPAKSIATGLRRPSSWRTRSRGWSLSALAVEARRQGFPIDRDLGRLAGVVGRVQLPVDDTATVGGDDRPGVTGQRDRERLCLVERQRARVQRLGGDLRRPVQSDDPLRLLPEQTVQLGHCIGCCLRVVRAEVAERQDLRLVRKQRCTADGDLGPEVELVQRPDDLRRQQPPVLVPERTGDVVQCHGGHAEVHGDRHLDLGAGWRDGDHAVAQPARRALQQLLDELRCGLAGREVLRQPDLVGHQQVPGLVEEVQVPGSEFQVDLVAAQERAGRRFGDAELPVDLLQLEEEVGLLVRACRGPLAARADGGDLLGGQLDPVALPDQ
jgi:hypothetical protein